MMQKLYPALITLHYIVIQGSLSDLAFFLANVIVVLPDGKILAESQRKKPLKCAIDQGAFVTDNVKGLLLCWYFIISSPEQKPN
jgi:hypothetical protein